jgi:CHAT domain-containing protein
MSGPELARRVAIVSQILEIASVSRGEADSAGGPSPVRTEFEQALQDVYDGLIKPLEWALKDVHRLVISPYADLHAIPFAILPMRGHPLIARHPLTLVPSLSLLRRICTRRQWTGGPPKRAYIVGNPATKVQSRLPAAEKEAKLVAARLGKAGVPADSISLRLAEEATEDSYRCEARNADLVHLACHARVREPAYDSRLYLAPSGPFDGILLASEVAQVQLSDAIVFLAACETAQGRFAPDGVVGLVRAFLEAGARAVIASLWRVDDSATYTFVRHFYAELLRRRGSAPVSEAIRSATLATRKDLRAGKIKTQDGHSVEYSAANWGAFMVFGDGFSAKYGGSE